MKPHSRAHLLSCVFTIGGAVLLGDAAAQEISGAEASAEAALQESREIIIVTGARGRGRTVLESAVPVDVIDAGELESVSFTDTNDIIRTLVPSYNLTRQPISDGATFVRPASMRGLPTDKTLVLVNNYRRHRAALVQIGGAGTQGPDIATIPSAALGTVEVLRDGAAAQYGSDAIAGVLNFILREESSGGSISAEIGEFYEGDGFQTTLSGYVGLPLGDSGFLTLSGEYSKADATIRARQYCESFFCLDPTNPVYNPDAAYVDFLTPEFYQAAAQLGPVVQPWGQPNSEAYRFFFNSGYDFGNGVEAYAFGNYSQSEADGAFFYRYPRNGTIEEIRLADGSIWDPLSFFPGGFTPRFFGEVFDYSVAGGIRGEAAGFTYDLHGRFGHNEIQYTLSNTFNPSLGPDSPLSFRPGDLINEEFQLQADFTRELDFGVYSPATLAFGVSYLDESYEIVEGDFEAHVAGPYASPDPWGLCDGGAPSAAGAAAIAGGSTLDCANSADPVYRVMPVGSNGFPGYPPEFTGTYSRDSWAAFVDLSADLTDRLFVQGALRYEDYSDFGSELTWKAAGRFALTDNAALRGSVGTGFRAPTPGQQGTTNVSTRLPEGVPVATGLFPAGGPVAQALGATPLRPETSTNYTLGLTGNLGPVTVSLDYYRIELEDRVQAISTQTVSTDPTAGQAYENYLALVGAGVAGAETIGGVFYFTNAFDTVTQGVDLVATYVHDWGAAGQTSFTGSLNYNTTEYDSEVGGLFNQAAQYNFLNGTPEWRGVFTASHSIDRWTLLGRANTYSSYSYMQNDAQRTQDFGEEIFFDAEISYQATDIVRLTVGARNIFDNYPDESNLVGMGNGRIYRSDSIVDWQGGYYYFRVRADF